MPRTQKKNHRVTVISVPSFGGSLKLYNIVLGGFLIALGILIYVLCFRLVPRSPVLYPYANVLSIIAPPAFRLAFFVGVRKWFTLPPVLPLLQNAPSSLIVIVCKTAYKPRQNAFKVRSNREQKPPVSLLPVYGSRMPLESF